MTKFITGKANLDVSAKILEEITALLKKSEPQKIIYIVPDQFEYETEKALYRALKSGGLISRYEEIRISTFSALSEELIETLGDKRRTADDIVKSIIMHRVIKENKNELEAFGRIADKSGFCEKMVQTVSMLKTAGITPYDLGRDKLSDNEGDRKISDYALLSAKLSDVALLYLGYSERLSKSYLDKLDFTAMAAELITKYDNPMFFDSEVFVDGFNDFSASQMKFLSKVIATADDVTFGFVTEYHGHADEGRAALFSAVNSQIDRLSAAAQESGSEVVRISDGLSDRYPKDSPLHFLCDNIFSRKRHRSAANGCCEAVRAGDVCEELDYAAARIKQLVRDKGFRYRDIAVLCTDPITYRSYIQNAFEKYDIPFFCDIPESILYQPLINFVISLLNAVKTFSVDNVLSYVKTGFLCRTVTDSSGNKKKRRLTKKDIDVLETYIFEWAVTSDALKAPFEIKQPEIADGASPEIRQAIQRKAAEPEEIRRAVVEPLLRLSEAVRGKNGDEITRLVFDFIVNDIDIHEALYQRYRDLGGNGNDTELVKSYQRLWDTLAGIFDALYHGLQGDRISLADYCRLFRDICAGTTLAKPPQYMDGVLVGDISRTRASNVRAAFIVGATDELFPAPAAAVSVFSPFETEILRKSITNADTAFSPNGYCLKSSDEQYCQSLYYAYRAVTLPSELLCISCPDTDLSGHLTTRSEVIDRISALFEDVRIISASEMDERFWCGSIKALKQRYAAGVCSDSQSSATLRQALLEAGEGDFVEKLSEVRLLRSPDNVQMQQMDYDIAGRLFPREISATKIETLNLCSFLFFCENGLKIRERIQRSFNSSQRGSAVHYVMQRVLEQYSPHMEDFFLLGRGELTKLTERYLGEYKRMQMSESTAQDKRFDYLYGNIAMATVDVLIVVQAEFAARDYRPKFFELNLNKRGEHSIIPNGEQSPSAPKSLMVRPLTLKLDGEEDTVRITGIIDRVDMFTDKDGKSYLRVVDYKTNARSFTKANAEYGINTQMLTYLFALCEANRNEDGTERLLPGAVSYTSAKVSGAVTSQMTAFDLLTTAYRQSGMYILDGSTQNEMLKYADAIIGRVRDENGETGELDSKELGRRRAKYLPDKENLIDRSGDFEQFRTRVIDTITSNLQTIFSGDVTANPIQYKEKLQRGISTGSRIKSPCDYCRFSQICGNAGKRFRQTEDTKGEEQ